jgi:hypothetical protein
MADNYRYLEQARVRQQYSDASLDSGYTQSLPPTTEGLASAYSVLGSGAGYMGGSGSSYGQAMQTMQSAYGNRSLQRYMGGQSHAYSPGATASIGGGMSTMAFPNNPTPQIPSIPGLAAELGNMINNINPELDAGVWGNGPTTWGGEIGGALHRHEDVPIFGGVPSDSEFGFGNIKFGNWQGENGTVQHGFQGEAGLGRAELGVKDENWISGEVGTISGGANFSNGIGGEAALAKLSGGVLGKELFDVSAGTLEDRAGLWQDDEGWRAGFKGNASLFDMNFFKDVPWLPGIQIEGPKAGAELNAGAGGISAGIGTNLIGGALTFGDFTKGGDTESSTRFGLGLGTNFGARLHSTDTDGDKQTEYGFGFDAGVVSFDMKSEDPLRSLANGIMTSPFALVPPVYAATQAASYLGFQNPLLPEGNMTNAAVDMASSAGGMLWDAAEGALEGVDTRNFLGSVGGVGNSLWDSATDTLGGLW